MSKTEPFIHVGILSGSAIEFVLNAEFVCTNGKTYTGPQVVEFKAGKIYFDGQSASELTLWLGFIS